MVPNVTALVARTTMSSNFNSTNSTLGLNSTFIVPMLLSQEEFLALQVSNSSDNGTSNDTIPVVLKTWYPSGYSPAHIILASVVVTVLMIMVVVGNMLVIIAIVTEKALKNIQNWFIASLAVSDFFLGLVIMPFSLANELMGYWIFGFWWCEIHSAMDVLLCTASIMNLCLISLDRYWSITQIYGLYISFIINKPICNRKQTDNLSDLCFTFAVIFFVQGIVLLLISLSLGITTYVKKCSKWVNTYVVIVFSTYALQLIYFLVLIGVVLSDDYYLCYKGIYKGLKYGYSWQWGWPWDWRPDFVEKITLDVKGKEFTDSYFVLIVFCDSLHGLVYIYFAIVVNSYALQYFEREETK